MGKKSRGKKKNIENLAIPEGWDPRGKMPPPREFTSVATDLGHKLTPNAPWSAHPASAVTRAREAQSVEIPVSVLGPPRNEFERRSPALQAMRMLGEGGLGDAGLPDPAAMPSSYEVVEAGDAIDPAVYPHHFSRDPEREDWADNSDLDPDTVFCRAAWTPTEVLDAHAWLAERHARPDGYMLDYLEYFMQDALGKSRGRAQGMFYPVDLRDVEAGKRPSEGHARHLSALIAAGLGEAVTYEVTEDMVDVMRQVHDKTQESITHIDEAELPEPAGFAWLDKPWVVTDTNGNFVPVRALTWELDYAWTDGTESVKLQAPERIPCARVALWTYMDDDIAFGRWPNAEDRAREVEGQLGGLTMMHIALLPFGARFGFKDESAAAKHPESILSLLHTLWMFLGMEIVGTPLAENISRTTKRRAARSLKNSDVRVVILRKIKRTKDDSGEHSAAAWSCRWVVQGHWRHIDAYPGERHHAVREIRALEKYGVCGVCRAAERHVRVTWVGPYVKGPDGKQLKPAEPRRVLYKLAR